MKRVLSYSAFISFLLLTFLACSQSDVLPGAVATVNGHPISFVELEARRNVLYPLPFEKFFNLSEMTLKKQYTFALKQLIQEQIIKQYMEQKTYSQSSAEQVSAKEKQIRADYPDTEFDAMLLQEGITQQEWHNTLTTQVIIEQFIATVIRPQIKISSEEVEQYYLKHRADFILPERWHYILLQGHNKETLQQVSKSFLESRDTAVLQSDFTVTAREIQLGKDRLPEDVATILASLNSSQSSPAQKHGEQYRIFILLGKEKSRSLNPAEIYERVEQVITEKKVDATYQDWLNKRIKKSIIKIAPIFLSPMN